MPNVLNESHDVSEEAASTILEQLDTLTTDMSGEETLTTLQKMRDGITERMDAAVEGLVYGESIDDNDEEGEEPADEVT